MLTNIIYYECDRTTSVTHEKGPFHRLKSSCCRLWTSCSSWLRWEAYTRCRAAVRFGVFLALNWSALPALSPIKRNHKYSQGNTQKEKHLVHPCTTFTNCPKWQYVYVRQQFSFETCHFSIMLGSRQLHSFFYIIRLFIGIFIKEIWPLWIPSFYLVTNHYFVKSNFLFLNIFLFSIIW